jgi:DNA replication protein DnaC
MEKNKMTIEINEEQLLIRARALKLYGVVENWKDLQGICTIRHIIEIEDEARLYRGLERRLSNARIGQFKDLAQFDWTWPRKCDRSAIEEFMHLEFIKTAANLIFCGPNGVGKSMIVRNIAHQAVVYGYTVLFTTAGHMLNDLAAQDGDNALRRRIKYYAQPHLLVIDEVGYLSYSNRHADLLFEIISRRYQEKSIVITTNKPFSEWNEIFPNASCVVSLIDRLVHHSEIISIDADSYRLKEAKEQTLKRKEERKSRKDF